MSSPVQSGGAPRPADLFEDLWRQLGECHRNILQELEAKVSRLKKERCLDAQRLEVFYNRTQQLKEQKKSLQDAITLMEERLRTRECDRCAILGENLKNNQDQNLRLIAKLKNERNSLEDENRKLYAELQKLKMSSSEPQQASSPEQEEGVIPDSPILPSSVPVANKLKRRKNIDKIKHVRYAEMPLSQSNNSLFNELNKEPVDATNPGRAEVLVPNTCELETSLISNDVGLNMEDMVAETCGFELLDKPHMKTETTGEGQKKKEDKSPWKYGIHLKPYCPSLSSTMINPDSTTERSPSLLPRVKRFSEDCSVNKAKRKKEEGEPEVQDEDKQGIQEGVDKQKGGKHTQPEPIKRSPTPLSNQSFKKESPVMKSQSTQNGMSCQRPNVPAERKHKVEPMWSIDPALALSMYDSEWRRDEEEEESRAIKEEEQCHGELADTDCTWVSHSLLQGRGENARDRRDSVSGLGEKANDSLDMMFDTTAYGEYKSYNSSHLGQSQPCDDEEEEEEDEEDDEDPHENTMSQCKAHKAGRPTFAHVAVVRKKDERRKLKGTTCKECEIYYAHLPEEEKHKKLSACSRHRFLYIPPCTPENFWEVGFPSTQTCIDRGYIREEKIPQARSRRRQPLNALFSPKRKQENS